jgi:hypothetical protein
MNEKEEKKFEVMLVSEFPKKLNKTLISMPFFNEYDFLYEHLKALNKQTYKDFDLLIVAEPESDEKRILEIIKKVKPKFQVIVVKRLVNSGPAGGNFCGEIFAVTYNYENIIYADVDSIPIDNDLIEELIKNVDEKSFVTPKEISLLDGKRIFTTNPSINHYNCLKVYNLKVSGFRYLPYYYIDDDEFPLRLKKLNFERKKINKYVVHQYKVYALLRLFHFPIFYPATYYIFNNPLYGFLTHFNFILKEIFIMLFSKIRI